MIKRHMKFGNDRNRKSENEDIANHVQESYRLIEGQNARDTSTQLCWFGTPVVGD